MNHTPHDSFFGETFSIQAIALESMQMVLPASVLEELDLDNMKLEESKFQADDKNLIADVYKYTPDGKVTKLNPIYMSKNGQLEHSTVYIRESVPLEGLYRLINALEDSAKVQVKK